MSVCVLQDLEKDRVLWTDFLASCRQINRFSVSKIGPEPAKPTISLALEQSMPYFSMSSLQQYTVKQLSHEELHCHKMQMLLSFQICNNLITKVYCCLQILISLIKLQRKFDSNINVPLPNLVSQMGISVLNFFSVAKPQKFELQKKKKKKRWLERQQTVQSKQLFLTHSLYTYIYIR